MGIYDTGNSGAYLKLYDAIEKPLVCTGLKSLELGSRFDARDLYSNDCGTTKYYERDWSSLSLLVLLEAER
ncbi:hypothetical protein BGX24_000421 [Mortierella sp. AD032]|nr:hypothetical protein BGX24_000421 [Mortierella sp. AD032]